LSPDDNANVDLGAADKVTFRWETDVPAANFTLVFSKAADLSAPRSVQAQGYAHELSADAFDAILAELGTAAGTSQSLYWTVKPGFSEQPTYWTRTITVKRIVGTPVNITLTAPANGNATQLTKTNGTQTMTFSWSAAPTTVASAPYSLVFSANPDMSNATSINDIASTSYAISQDDLQDLLFTNSAALGLKKYKENIVYWKVKVDGRLSSGATGNIKLTGMPIFKDVRGDEAITYDVSIITYPDGRTMIWTSNNLRTKKDVHGEDLPANPPYVHDPVEDGFDPIAENAPFLLEPDRGLYYCLYRFEHDFKESIVPEGWKMPTWDDWFELYQAAADMYPQQTKWPQGNDYYTDIVALVDPKYANNDIKNHPNINAWKMNMRPTGRYLYESYGLHIDINSWPAMWFFAFDNEPRPHGTHGRGALFPGDGGPTFGYSICYSCDARQLYDSEYTGGAVMRLIYVGE
jgi:hypothetical protein